MSIGFELIDYQTLDGHCYEAIRVPWYEVTELLGHEHTGTSSEDNTIVAALLMSGAPAWVTEAEGWLDEHGWGLVGPQAE